MRRGDAEPLSKSLHTGSVVSVQSCLGPNNPPDGSLSEEAPEVSRARHREHEVDGCATGACKGTADALTSLAC